MPRAAVLKTNFTAGEFSPRMLGRADIAKYDNGAEEMLNVFPIPQGGAVRRPGTRYVSNIKTDSETARLVDFEFSTEQAYILEFGNTYFRMFKDRGTITAATVSASISNGTFDSSLTGWTASSVSHSSGTALFAASGTLDQSISITETTTDHVFKFQIVGDARADKVKVRFGTSAGGEEIASDREFEVGWHTYTINPGSNSTIHVRFSQSAGTPALDNVEITSNARVELTTPFPNTALNELYWTQSADVLYCAHPDYPPRKITRLDDTSWSITELNFLDGPYLDQNTTATTMTPAATTGDGVTVTASSATFESTDVGRLIRITTSGTTGYAVIVGFTSSTQVSVDIKSDFGGTTAQTTWRLGAWSDTTGWPSAVTFFQERLVFGRCTNQPQTIWMSVVADFENFAPTNTSGTVSDDNAITVTISDDRVNSIIWFSSGQRLAIGTNSAEFTLGASTSGSTVTPTDILVQRQTTHGSANLRAIRIGPVVLFCQRQAKRLREFSFSFQLDQFNAPDLTILADHVTGTGLVDIDYQQEPYSILWGVRQDGTLVGMTYERDQEVVGWHRHVLGGVSDASGTQAQVESLRVIPGSGQDELWMIVKRYINGQTVRFVEYMTYDFDPNRNAGDTKETAFFVDAGLTYDGSSTSTLSGLSHLEGESVQILGNGAVLPNRTVSSGAVTPSVSVTKASIGLSFTSRVRLLRPEAGAADGTAQGKQKRVHEAVVRLYESLGLRYGSDVSDLYTLPFREGSVASGSSPELFTGDKVLPLAQSWGLDGRIYLEQDQPLPMNIVAVILRLITSDG